MPASDVFLRILFTILSDQGELRHHPDTVAAAVILETHSPVRYKK